MIEPTITWIEATKNAVKSLQERYKQNRGMLLTEGDLECQLFSELMNQPVLSGYHPSKFTNPYGDENIEILKTSYIHSQVTWFKVNQKSGFEPDLTICKPGLLEVKNHELLLDYPSKGFAYDGPCVAIEIKFIRTEDKASGISHEDLRKFLEKLIPAKMANIKNGNYKISNDKNIAFISLVGCKNKEIFIQSKYYLGKHLSINKNLIPENLFVGLFYQDEIVWDQDNLISFYKKMSQLKTKPKKY